MTDNVRVAGYRVYRNGVLIRDTARRTFTDEGLAVSTEYSYHITAYDGAGNESGASVTVKAKNARRLEHRQTGRYAGPQTRGAPLPAERSVYVP